jgi:two-component system response regulator RstA
MTVPLEKSPRILLVEDDLELAGLTADRLRKEGWVVDVVGDGPAAVETVRTRVYDAMILDVMLPGFDGLEVCRRVRADFQGPILMLTARDEEIDEILGLELGADDYLRKPLRPRVLIARLKAALRRSELILHERAEAPLRVGTLTVDPGRREVLVNDIRVDFTSAEFDVLYVLARRAGRVVSRDDLYREVLQSEYDGLDRAIDVHVSRIRHKLGAGDEIRTVRGIGYQLAAAS